MKRIQFLSLVAALSAPLGAQPIPCKTLLAFKATTAHTTGVVSLQRVLHHWGLSFPDERLLTYDVLGNARRILGDRQFLAAAGRSVTELLHSPLALAATARQNGLFAEPYVRGNWDALRAMVKRGETVLVCWKRRAPEFSVVRAMEFARIYLESPGDWSHWESVHRQDFLNGWEQCEETLIRTWRPAIGPSPR